MCHYIYFLPGFLYDSFSHVLYPFEESSRFSNFFPRKLMLLFISFIFLKTTILTDSIIVHIAKIPKSQPPLQVVVWDGPHKGRLHARPKGRVSQALLLVRL